MNIISTVIGIKTRYGDTTCSSFIALKLVQPEKHMTHMCGSRKFSQRGSNSSKILTTFF